MRKGEHHPKRRSVRFNTAKFMAKVSEQRVARGMLIKDLAKITGVHRTTLGQLGTGMHSAPGGHVIASLLDWLGETDLDPYMIRTEVEDAGE